MNNLLTSPRVVDNIFLARRDPVWFVQNILGVKEIENYQKDVLYSLAQTNKVAWRSGHGVGKTAVASWAALWFYVTRYSSKVITTATSWRQVQKQLWPEIHRWRRGARWDLIGYEREDLIPLGLMLKMRGMEEWFVTGEASDEAAKMEGFHAPSLFYIVDEGKAVPDETYEALEGALTNAEGETKLLVISTPSPVKAGYFYEIFSGKKIGFKTFHTNAYDSPRVSKQWIAERKEEWGEDSVAFITRVKGDFAEAGADTVIPLGWIEKAMETLLKVAEDSPIEIGVDVARFGEDETVVTVRRGPKVYEQKVTVKEETTQTTGRVIDVARQYRRRFPDLDIYIKPDVIGIGAGVVDQLNEQSDKEGFVCLGVNTGLPPIDKEKFLNLRAELWWGLRERFQSGDIDLTNVQDDRLTGQLTNIKYKYKARGQLYIESKEDMKKRGLKSPDRADSLILAFAPLTGLEPRLII